ncbi:helix-turn-helix transcriptional regulator [Gordonia sp. (in: high G+C Gram-positive bacteria)]|jgi:transcriptional regulator with XRE-family HTH domain|uniref:helix-turn-helix domain-containing protein n=1 Tax=Gordonia sp. (in: high G+C Gram-positive bacteria) TaxID=84139 RepID=UPI001D1D6103|nr:helix-turn-helix transcriptional regulator [Gordonia sp. (in: high G+C Gram-positive bacteria)]MCB1294039.1 helix-turn-helix transcriptional regulator [Gordonia sp. (in: high G+C Gram-positive bacteria)]HMS76718.1 helix-turn-helix transcriptional regulator [Gordonia sp. (in: high G+C Gram-positive bacteria)]HQV18575.1 helix-turn-helix transcriptional regulator [Gordonia sp. (in: high G+C Gram-positive bacteria)]
MSTPFNEEAIDDLGRYIKAQREIARLSVRHLARMAEVSDSYLSQIEKGRYQPSAQVLTNLAKGLNLQPDVLFRMAGWLPTTPAEEKCSVEDAIRHDDRLTEGQRSALVQLYRTMVGD